MELIVYFMAKDSFLCSTDPHSPDTWKVRTRPQVVHLGSMAEGYRLVGNVHTAMLSEVPPSMTHFL